MLQEFGYLKAIKMILKNNDLSIQVINEDIVVDTIKINQNLNIVDLLKEKTKHIDVFEIDQIKDHFSRNECMVLLAISFNIKMITDKSGNKYEVTFSYHFPVNREKNFLKTLLNNLDYLIKGNLINLATYGEFLVCSVNEDFNYLDFQKKYDYLVKHDDKIISIRIDNAIVSDVLNHWNKYCDEKFNRIFNKETINAYNFFYSTSDFHTICLIDPQNKTIAEGIVYESKETKTLYYCIFWWDQQYKSLSPGIYNYIKTMYYCNRHNLKFSFCYGLQDYKLKLLNPFLKNKIGL